MENKTIQTQKMEKNFPFFGIVSAVYAVFYTFCMYRNTSGITLPFFIAGSLLFGYLCMQKLEISVKKDAFWYAVCLVLLSISSVCTDDGTIHFFNYIGIFLLFICLLIHQFFEDREWGFGKYLQAIFLTLFGTVSCIANPFLDAVSWCDRKEKKKGGKGRYVLLGLLIASPLILLVGILLLTSDYVIRDMFVRLFRRMFENRWSLIFDIILIPMIIFSMFLAAYAIFAYLAKRKIREEVKDVRSGEPVIMITIIGILSVIYLFYSVIQILYLFLGKLSLPEGYTYAEYAREGFFQLLVVCIINLILVLVSIRFFKKSRILQAILIIVSACTYIMLASSALRMIMYIRYFYLTYSRVLVLWTLAVLFILLTGLVITIFKEKFPLFRYGIIVVSVCYLILAFAHPDYWIAKINTENINKVQAEGENAFFCGEPYDDYCYLATLSLDAASVVKPVLEEKSSYLCRKEKRWMNRFSTNQEKMNWQNWRSWNLSRYLASKLE